MRVYCCFCVKRLDERHHPAKRHPTIVRNTENLIGPPNVPWNLCCPSTFWAKLIHWFAVYVDTSDEYPKILARVDISPKRYHGRNTMRIPNVERKSILSKYLSSQSIPA